MTRRSRTALIAGLALFLVLAGGSGAAAYWSAQASVPATASTARIGLAQTAATSTLAGAYSSTALRFAGSITVQNTGSRGAAYTVALTPSSATVAGLPGAIAVAAAPVANTAACTATTALSSPQAGTASAFAATGTIPAGGTVVLCVQTSMTTANVSAFAGASTVMRLRASLEYAPTAAWRLSGAEAAFTQSVSAAPAGSPMTCTDGGGWTLDLHFAEDTMSHSIRYRYFLARETSPAVRVPFTPDAEASPWWPVVQLSPGNASLRSFLTSPDGGMGNTWVFVERSANGNSGPWVQVAHGRFSSATSPEGLRTWCGWR